MVAKAGKLVASGKFASLDVKAVPAYYDSNDDMPLRPTTQEFFIRVVNAAWLAHISGHGVSVSSIISEDRQLPPKPVRDLLETPRFKKACEDRGIPSAKKDYLSPKMVAALRTVADPTLNEMSERKRVEALGIKWNEFLGWMDYEPFRAKYRLLMSKVLDVAVDRADVKLAELIDAGNLKAIEYANEKTGRFVRGEREAQNFNQMLVVVLSVLKKNVTDAGTLEAIADDLKQLGFMQTAPENREDIVDAEVVPDGDDDDPELGLHPGGAGDERAVLDSPE